MMKLLLGSPGITRILDGSRGTRTQIRFPALKPGSSLIPCCAAVPPWQPETAQVGEKTLAWIDAKVGSSGAPGWGGVSGGVPALLQAGADACPKGTPFSSRPSPLPAPQPARRRIATAAAERNRGAPVGSMELPASCPGSPSAPPAA